MKSFTERYFILQISILILAGFLRFYQLPDLAIFTFDEEHQITMAKTIVDDFHIIWIGVSASNLGFYLGPFWVYFTAFWLWLSKGDPLITNFVGASIGVLTTLAIYYVSARLFNKKVGIIASLLYACLPIFVFFDQKYLTPNPVPLVSLVLLFSLFQSMTSGKWWIIFALGIGLTFHTSLSIFPYALIGFFFLLRGWRKVSKKIFAFSLAIFLFTFSPLIAFDYFHNWSNLTTPLRFKEISTSSLIFDLPTRFNYFSESLGRIWYLKQGLSNADEIPFACGTIFRDMFPNYDFDSIRTKPIWIFSFLSLCLLTWFLIRKETWRNLNGRILALSFLILSLSFLLFHGGPFEYYMLGLFPLVLIVFAYFVSLLPKYLYNVVLCLVAILCILGLNTVLNVNKNYGLSVKRELINLVMAKIGSDTFTLENSGVCHKYDGWRYLFLVYGRKPERSNTDESLGWLYPHQISNLPAKYTVILSESKILPNLDISKAVIIEKGGFRAYILDNENSISE